MKWVLNLLYISIWTILACVVWIGFFAWQSYAQSMGWVSSQTWSSINKLTINTEDMASNYARRIELLIAQKWESVRANMIIIMQKFLNNYTITHPLYTTIERMINIIKIGEFAHKIEYCTQYTDSYHLNIFGIDVTLRSTIKYNSVKQRCDVTFTYPDSSIQTCLLQEEHKLLLAQSLIDKQWLYASEWSSFESVLDSLIKSKICIEQ